MSSFTPAGSGGVPQQVTVNGATNPQIMRVLVTLNNTEYSAVLPIGTRQYMLRLEDGSTKFQVAYEPGESSVNYIPVPRYCFLSESDIILTAPKTIYFQSPLAAQTAVLSIWT